MRAVIDSNILIDYLSGVDLAAVEISRYESPSISMITCIEVLTGATAKNEKGVRQFLRTFTLLEIDTRVAERAVLLRKSHRIRLPDAVIWATAQVHQCLLVSRNTRDFDPNDPGIRVPYTI